MHGLIGAYNALNEQEGCSVEIKGCYRSEGSEQRRTGSYGWSVSQAVDPCLDKVYPDYWAELFGERHNVLETEARQPVCLSSTGVCGNGTCSFTDRRCPSGYEKSWGSSSVLNSGPWRSAHLGQKEVCHVKSGGDGDWVKAWSVSNWKKSLAREGVHIGQLDSMNLDVEGIVASIWRKVENEMESEVNEVSKWKSREQSEPPSIAHSLEDARGIQEGGTSVLKTNGKLEKREKLLHSGFPKKHSEICTDIPSHPVSSKKEKDICDTPPFSAMIDWVNEHEAQALGQTMPAHQPKAWEVLSFADRDLVSTMFIKWETHVEVIQIKEEAANLCSQQCRLARAFRQWLLYMISAMEARKCQEAKERAKMLHHLSIADQFYDAALLHKVIRAWRNHTTEEQCAREKEALNRAHARQVRKEEQLKLQVSTKFHHVYLMSRHIHYWRCRVQDEKRRKSIVSSEAMLHSKIQNFIENMSVQQLSDQPRSIDEKPSPDGNTAGVAEQPPPSVKPTMDVESLVDGEAKQDTVKSTVSSDGKDTLQNPLANGEGTQPNKPCSIPDVPSIQSRSKATGGMNETEKKPEESSLPQKPPKPPSSKQSMDKIESQCTHTRRNCHPVIPDNGMHSDSHGLSGTTNVVENASDKDQNKDKLPKLGTLPGSLVTGEASVKHKALVLDRELARRQVSLAQLHFSRALLRRCGWKPWREVTAQGRIVTTRAKEHAKQRGLRSAIMKWKLCMMGTLWRRVVNEALDANRAVHFSRNRVLRSMVGAWRRLVDAVQCRKRVLRNLVFRILANNVHEEQMEVNKAAAHYSIRLMHTHAHCWSSNVQTTMKELVVWELREEARIRSVLDAVKKSNCFKAWNLQYKAALFQREDRENQDKAWTQVRSWIEELQLKRNKSECSTALGGKIIFTLEEDDVDEDSVISIT